MKIWFCETCGKRVTEDDVAQNKAHDKQAKGVYCANCAVGVHTTSFDAVELPSTAPATVAEPRLAAAPAKSSRARPAAETSRQRSAAPRGQPQNKKTMLVMVGAGAVVVLGGLLLLLKSGDESTPPRQDTSAKHEAGPTTAVAVSSPATNISEAPKTKNPPPAPVQSTPANEVAPSTKTQALSADEQAEAAFDRLQKAQAALPEQDKAGRIALAEAFLKDYGDAILAGRARAMISKWREPVVVAPPPAAEKPPAETATGTPQGFTSLLSKDLSTWTITSESKDCSIVDGELIIGPGFRGKLDTPIKLKDFVLEIEYFFENASGAGMELGTPAGYIEVNRTSAGHWNTIQLTVQGGKLSAKYIVGSGELKPVDNGSLDGAIRMYAISGAKKTIRAIRIAEIKP